MSKKFQLEKMTKIDTVDGTSVFSYDKYGANKKFETLTPVRPKLKVS